MYTKYSGLIAVALAVALMMTIAAPAMAAPPWLRDGEDQLPPGLSRGGIDALQRHQERWETMNAEMEENSLRQMERVLGFEDMDEATWALPYVARTALGGLMVGRGAGNFAPNSPMKRAEVITVAVRMLGEVERTEPLLFRLDGVEWSEGWLEIGAALDLYDNEENFRPNAAAQRQWVASVLISVLEAAGFDLDDEEEADLRDFNDYPAIADAHYEDLALAVGMGIFSGYPNGTIRSRAPITRAEFATVLGEMGDLLDIDLPASDRPIGDSISGVLIGIDEEEESLEVSVTGEERVFDLAGDVEVWLKLFDMDWTRVNLEDLLEGDVVQLWFDDEDRIEYIFARGEYVEIEASFVDMEFPDEDEGYIDVVVDSEEEKSSFVVRESSLVQYEFSPYGGDAVTLRVRGDVAREVTIEPSEEYPAHFGLLHSSDIGEGGFTLDLLIAGEDDPVIFSGDPEDVAISGDFELDDLIPGYEIELRTDGEGGAVVVIWVYAHRGEIAGEFKSIEDGVLVIDFEGTEIEFIVDDDDTVLPEGWPPEQGTEISVKFDGYFALEVTLMSD